MYIYIQVPRCIYNIYINYNTQHIYIEWCVSILPTGRYYYGVAMISRLLKNIGFFCRI